MRLGIGMLGLAPDVFWRLTLYELVLMAQKGKAPKKPFDFAEAFVSTFNPIVVNRKRS